MVIGNVAWPLARLVLPPATRPPNTPPECERTSVQKLRVVTVAAYVPRGAWRGSTDRLGRVARRGARVPLHADKARPGRPPAPDLIVITGT